MHHAAHGWYPMPTEVLRYLQQLHSVKPLWNHISFSNGTFPVSL